MKKHRYLVFSIILIILIGFYLYKTGKLEVYFEDKKVEVIDENNKPKIITESQLKQSEDELEKEIIEAERKSKSK